MGIYRTTKSGRGRAGHNHVIYFRDDEFVGICSVNKDHSHEVVLDEEGGWKILTAHKHDHEIEDEVSTEITKSDIDRDEEKSVEEVRQLFKVADTYEQEFRDSAEEADEFYYGDQWTDEALDHLGEDRPALTFNETEGKIDLLSGYQRQNRTDLKFMPVEGGDATVADILTHVTKNITNRNNYDYAETEVFEDMEIVGRGLLHVYPDYNDSVDGDIKIEHYQWDECHFGPHADKECKDLEYYTKEKWLSWAMIQKMYPEKKDKIRKAIEYYEELGEKSKKEFDVDNYAKGGEEIAYTTDADFVDIAKKEYRLIECRNKEYSRFNVLVNVQDNVYESVQWGNADIESAKSIGFQAVPRVKTDIRVRVIAGDTLLEDYIDDIYDGLPSIIPFYAKKRKDKVWGKVKAMMDPQREENKRMSQVMDIINKMASYGWFYDDQTFVRPEDARNFEKKVSSPGFTQKVRNTQRPPERIEGPKFPAEVANLAQIASDKLNRISNIPFSLEGFGTREESGVAIAEKKRQGLVGNEFLFDNLSLGKRMLGKVLVKLIQKMYSPERIYRILENQNAKKQIELGGLPFMPELPPEVEQLPIEQQIVIARQLVEERRAQILNLLNNADLTKYDVVVSESAFNPTMRHANFMMWSEIARTMPVPPEFLLDLSDLPDKEKVVKMFQQMRQAEAEDKERTRQVELFKATKGQMPQQGGD